MKKLDKIMIIVFRILGIIAIFVATGLFIAGKTGLIDFETIGLVERDIITLSTSLFVVSVLLIALSLALKSKIKNDMPIIKMSEDGFIDNGPMEIGLIPWSNIEKFTVYEVMDGYNSRKYLGICIKDLGLLCSQVSEIKAEMAKANAASGAPAVLIPQTLIREDLNKLIEKIVRYQKEISYREH